MKTDAPMGSDMPEEIWVEARIGLGKIRTYFHQQLTDTVKYLRADISAARIAVLEEGLCDIIDTLQYDITNGQYAIDYAHQALNNNRKE